MYVSYDRYRIFYYVAKYGNISQAAKVLLNNQPNLTRTIKNLEGDLGCTRNTQTTFCASAIFTWGTASEPRTSVRTSLSG